MVQLKSRPTKRSSPANSVRRPPPPKPAATERPAVRRPFLRFHHSAPLRTKTLAVLERLENSRDPTRHTGELAEVIIDLTRCGLDTYFMQSLRRASAGFLVEQSAGLGLAAAMNVISAIVRSVVGSMGAPQLLSVCASIRAFMR